MDKQKSVSGYPFHNEETSMHPHSKIIRQDSETFIVEDENTIYEIDKHCAARHGYLPQQRNWGIFPHLHKKIIGYTKEAPKGPLETGHQALIFSYCSSSREESESRSSYYCRIRSCHYRSLRSHSHCCRCSSKEESGSRSSYCRLRSHFRYYLLTRCSRSHCSILLQLNHSWF